MSQQNALVSRGSRREMRAAVLEAPGHFVTHTVPMPEPGPGQLRVEVEGCGVCASNLAPWGGQPWFEYPFRPGAPGHEGWGRVDAVGEGVAAFRPGDRIAFLSGAAYAGYDLAAEDQAVLLPSELDGQHFPGEPLGCVMNIFERSRIEAGQTVAIVGIGFLGALLTRLASRAGARVIAISRRPFSLQIATRMGADQVLSMDDHDAVVERVAELTDGRMCDRVIEAVGRQEPLDLASRLSRERATLVIAGYHQDGPRQVDMQLWNWRGLDVINAHERDPEIYRRGMEAAVAATLSGQLSLEPLLTHVYPLERMGEALNATRDRPEGFLKAVIVP